MRLNKISLAAVVLCSSVLLAACGGGGGDNLEPARVASENKTVSVDKTNGPAAVQSVLDKDFVFGTGVPDFGTAPAKTTLKLSGTGAAPQFAISAGADQALGTMTYGSCIFKVDVSSTFANDHLLALGKTVTVKECKLSIGTAGKPADGNAFIANVFLVLGATTSSPISLTTSISPSGAVTVNGVAVTNVPLVSATGATGGGS